MEFYYPFGDDNQCLNLADISAFKTNGRQIEIEFVSGETSVLVYEIPQKLFQDIEVICDWLIYSELPVE